MHVERPVTYAELSLTSLQCNALSKGNASNFQPYHAGSSGNKNTVTDLSDELNRYVVVAIREVISTSDGEEDTNRLIPSSSRIIAVSNPVQAPLGFFGLCKKANRSGGADSPPSSTLFLPQPLSHVVEVPNVADMMMMGASSNKGCNNHHNPNPLVEVVLYHLPHPEIVSLSTGMQFTQTQTAQRRDEAEVTNKALGFRTATSAFESVERTRLLTIEEREELRDRLDKNGGDAHVDGSRRQHHQESLSHADTTMNMPMLTISGTAIPNTTPEALALLHLLEREDSRIGVLGRRVVGVVAECQQEREARRGASSDGSFVTNLSLSANAGGANGEEQQQPQQITAKMGVSFYSNHCVDTAEALPHVESNCEGDAEEDDAADPLSSCVVVSMSVEAYGAGADLITAMAARAQTQLAQQKLRDLEAANGQQKQQRTLHYGPTVPYALGAIGGDGGGSNSSAPPTAVEQHVPKIIMHSANATTAGSTTSSNYRWAATTFDCPSASLIAQAAASGSGSLGHGGNPLCAAAALYNALDPFGSHQRDTAAAANAFLQVPSFLSGAIGGGGGGGSTTNGIGIAAIGLTAKQAREREEMAMRTAASSGYTLQQKMLTPFLPMVTETLALPDDLEDEDGSDSDIDDDGDDMEKKRGVNPSLRAKALRHTTKARKARFQAATFSLAVMEPIGPQHIERPSGGTTANGIAARNGVPISDATLSHAEVVGGNHTNASGGDGALLDIPRLPIAVTKFSTRDIHRWLTCDPNDVLGSNSNRIYAADSFLETLLGGNRGGGQNPFRKTFFDELVGGTITVEETTSELEGPSKGRPVVKISIEMGKTANAEEIESRLEEQENEEEAEREAMLKVHEQQLKVLRAQQMVAAAAGRKGSGVGGEHFSAANASSFATLNDADAPPPVVTPSLRTIAARRAVLNAATLHQHTSYKAIILIHSMADWLALMNGERLKGDSVAIVEKEQQHDDDEHGKGYPNGNDRQQRHQAPQHRGGKKLVRRPRRAFASALRTASNAGGNDRPLPWELVLQGARGRAKHSKAMAHEAAAMGNDPFATRGERIAAKWLLRVQRWKSALRGARRAKPLVVGGGGGRDGSSSSSSSSSDSSSSDNEGEEAENDKQRRGTTLSSSAFIPFIPQPLHASPAVLKAHFESVMRACIAASATANEEYTNDRNIDNDAYANDHQTPQRTAFGSNHHSTNRQPLSPTYHDTVEGLSDMMGMVGGGVGGVGGSLMMSPHPPRGFGGVSYHHNHHHDGSMMASPIPINTDNRNGLTQTPPPTTSSRALQQLQPHKLRPHAGHDSVLEAIDRHSVPNPTHTMGGSHHSTLAGNTPRGRGISQAVASKGPIEAIGRMKAAEEAAYLQRRHGRTQQENADQERNTVVLADGSIGYRSADGSIATVNSGGDMDTADHFQNKNTNASTIGTYKPSQYDGRDEWADQMNPPLAHRTGYSMNGYSHMRPPAIHERHLSPLGHGHYLTPQQPLAAVAMDQRRHLDEFSAPHQHQQHYDSHHRHYPTTMSSSSAHDLKPRSAVTSTNGRDTGLTPLHGGIGLSTNSTVGLSPRGAHRTSYERSTISDNAFPSDVFAAEVRRGGYVLQSGGGTNDYSASVDYHQHQREHQPLYPPSNFTMTQQEQLQRGGLGPLSSVTHAIHDHNQGLEDMFGGVGPHHHNHTHHHNHHLNGHMHTTASASTPSFGIGGASAAGVLGRSPAITQRTMASMQDRLAGNAVEGSRPADYLNLRAKAAVAAAHHASAGLAGGALNDEDRTFTTASAAGNNAMATPQRQRSPPRRPHQQQQQQYITAPTPSAQLYPTSMADPSLMASTYFGGPSPTSVMMMGHNQHSYNDQYGGVGGGDGMNTSAAVVDAALKADYGVLAADNTSGGAALVPAAAAASMALMAQRNAARSGIGGALLPPMNGTINRNNASMLTAMAAAHNPHTRYAQSSYTNMRRAQGDHLLRTLLNAEDHPNPLLLLVDNGDNGISSTITPSAKMTLTPSDIMFLTAYHYPTVVADVAPLYYTAMFAGVITANNSASGGGGGNVANGDCADGDGVVFDQTALNMSNTAAAPSAPTNASRVDIEESKVRRVANATGTDPRTLGMMVAGTPVTSAGYPYSNYGGATSMAPYNSPQMLGGGVGVGVGLQQNALQLLQTANRPLPSRFGAPTQAPTANSARTDTLVAAVEAAAQRQNANRDHRSQLQRIYQRLFLLEGAGSAKGACDSSSLNANNLFTHLFASPEVEALLGVLVGDSTSVAGTVFGEDNESKQNDDGGDAHEDAITAKRKKSGTTSASRKKKKGTLPPTTDVLMRAKTIVANALGFQQQQSNGSFTASRYEWSDAHLYARAVLITALYAFLLMPTIVGTLCVGSLSAVGIYKGGKSLIFGGNLSDGRSSAVKKSSSSQQQQRQQRLGLIEGFAEAFGIKTLFGGSGRKKKASSRKHGGGKATSNKGGAKTTATRQIVSNDENTTDASNTDGLSQAFDREEKGMAQQQQQLPLYKTALFHLISLYQRGAKGTTKYGDGVSTTLIPENLKPIIDAIDMLLGGTSDAFGGVIVDGGVSVEDDTFSGDITNTADFILDGTYNSSAIANKKLLRWTYGGLLEQMVVGALANQGHAHLLLGAYDRFNNANAYRGGMINPSGVGALTYGRYFDPYNPFYPAASNVLLLEQQQQQQQHLSQPYGGNPTMLNASAASASMLHHHSNHALQEQQQQMMDHQSSIMRSAAMSEFERANGGGRGALPATYLGPLIDPNDAYPRRMYPSPADVNNNTRGSAVLGADGTSFMTATTSVNGPMMMQLHNRFGVGGTHGHQQLQQEYPTASGIVANPIVRDDYQGYPLHHGAYNQQHQQQRFQQHVQLPIPQRTANVDPHAATAMNRNLFDLHECAESYRLHAGLGLLLTTTSSSSSPSTSTSPFSTKISLDVLTKIITVALIKGQDRVNGGRMVVGGGSRNSKGGKSGRGGGANTTASTTDGLSSLPSTAYSITTRARKFLLEGRCMPLWAMLFAAVLVTNIVMYVMLWRWSFRPLTLAVITATVALLPRSPLVLYWKVFLRLFLTAEELN